jgi:asparagine synthase (glutamine-hydrolysing)
LNIPGQYIFLLLQLIFNNPQVFKVIYRVKKENLSYLNLSALLDLYYRIRQIDKLDLNGIFVEAGCALGGSALVIAASKSKDRSFFIFDTFKGIPPPSDNDGKDVHSRYTQIIHGNAVGKNGGKYYGYRENLLDEVISRFNDFGYPIGDNQITLVKGLFQHVMEINEPVAFAHLDCDWYESVLTCLNSIEPNLVSGGVIVIDDYFRWTGCRKAVDEYFYQRKDEYKFVIRNRLHIIRK